MLGKTGTGKSATGNSILGNNFFKSLASGSSISSECSFKRAIRFDRTILIVDTPGIFDTSKNNEFTQKEISKCVAYSSPGPHAFIFVLNISRFTEEEQNSIDHYIKYFGEKIYKYVIILFTRKDDLDQDNKELKDYINGCPEKLKTLIAKCNQRVHAFNNRLSGENQEMQVKTLLDMINKNVEENEYKCYTNEMYNEAEKLLSERENELRRRAQEEHEKSLQEIERKNAERFKNEYKEEVKKFENTQRQLEDLRSQLEQLVASIQKPYVDGFNQPHLKENEQTEQLNNKIMELTETLKNSKQKQNEIKRREEETIESLKMKEQTLYEEKIASARENVLKDDNQYLKQLSSIMDSYM